MEQPTSILSRRQFLSAMRRGPHREERSQPRVVEKIVFGYERAVPAALLVGFEQLKHKLKRAGLNVRVTFLPLDNLPDDVDVLLVTEDAIVAARRHAPNAELIALQQYRNSPEYSMLVSQLQEGVELRVKTGNDDTGTASEQSQTVKYRGYRRVE
jgi:mannitol-specific phosphotransferase system IIBC component